MHEIIRSYMDIVERIQKLDCERTCIGTTSSEYSLYQIVSLAKNPDCAPSILLSGGVHGREPAGTLAILQFFEREQREPRYRDLNIYAFPCVNPWGFERDVLEKADMQNINRQFFYGTAATEVKILMETLARGPRRYSFTMDMHETSPRDDDTSGPPPLEFYMWELCSHENVERFGAKVIEKLRKERFPICTWDTIFGDHSTDGVIYYPEGAHSPEYTQAPTFDAFLAKHYTDHAFTTETPTIWPIEDRVRAHLIALDTMLQAYRNWLWSTKQ